MVSCVAFQSSLAWLVLHTFHSDGILLLVLLSFLANISLGERAFMPLCSHFVENTTGLKAL